MTDLVELIHHAFLRGFGHTQEQIEQGKTLALPNYKHSRQATTAAVQALAEAGYVILPREPTEAMQLELRGLTCCDHYPNPKDTWATMIAAVEAEGKCRS